MNYSSDSDTSSLQLFDRDINFGSASDINTSPRNSSLSGEDSIAIPTPNDEYIAVIGGLGYIGSHTCLELLNAGYNVLVVDNLCNSYRIVSDHIYTLAKNHHEKKNSSVPLMHFREVDYRNKTKIRQLLREFMVLDLRGAERAVPKSRIVGVIHFAAYKSVSESIERPIEYYANNVAGLIEFCAVLSEFNIKKFIFSSSASVYGTIASSEIPLLREEHCVHQTETFIDELGNRMTHEAGCRGLTNPYSRSKWMCEAILSDIARSDQEWAITALRYFNPIGCDESGLLGEDPRLAPTNLMPLVTRVLLGQIPALKIFGVDYPNTPDGTAVRDYIHVTDLARGHILALTAAFKRKGFRTYNLGSGKGNSVRDVVQAIEEVSNRKVPIEIAPRREGDLEKCVALPKRAEEELKWKAEKSLNDACRDVLNFVEMENKGKLAT